MVVRGVAEAASGPYGPWRELLRALVVGGELKDFDASVLLPIVPELPRLLARPVTPAPELDGPSMHTRLRQVVLRLLQRQVRPVVLIPEDLQWASSATLELLRALEPHVASLPLLLLGTYRTEERAQLREQLASFRGVTLERLSPQAVGELAASMLGQAQVPPALVALLVRESEGNAFFVVEVVRALAEDAGGVDRIAERALPERVLAGGMRRVLRRRLDRLAPEHVAPLRLAAALGRRIEGELLAHAQPGLDVERWIRSGIDAAVLERIGGDTHFAHDKLREEVLRELSADERRALHARAAQALEGLHGDAPELAVALAMHHAAAGDTAREAYYSARAGEIALAHGAHHEAAERIERALVLRSDLTALERARLFYQLGSAYFYMMDFGRADAALRESARAVGVDIPAPGAAACALLARAAVGSAAAQPGGRAAGPARAPGGAGGGLAGRRAPLQPPHLPERRARRPGRQPAGSEPGRSLRPHQPPLAVAAGLRRQRRWPHPRIRPLLRAHPRRLRGRPRAAQPHARRGSRGHGVRRARRPGPRRAPRARQPRAV
jgi:tetratricopeptide (TPR) repeat protein